MFRAILLCISTGLRSTKQERAVALATRNVLARAGDPDAPIEAAPETQPYRDKPAIRRLLDSLPKRIEDWQPSGSCHLVRVSQQATVGDSRGVYPLVDLTMRVSGRTRSIVPAGQGDVPLSKGEDAS